MKLIYILVLILLASLYYLASTREYFEYQWPSLAEIYLKEKGLWNNLVRIHGVPDMSLRNTNCITKDGSFGYAIDFRLQGKKGYNHICIPTKKPKHNIISCQEGTSNSKKIFSNCALSTIPEHKSTIPEHKSISTPIHIKNDHKLSNQNQSNKIDLSNLFNNKSSPVSFTSMIDSKVTDFVPMSSDLNQVCANTFGPNYGVMKQEIFQKQPYNKKRGLCSKVYHSLLPRKELGSTYCIQGNINSPHTKKKLHHLCQHLFGNHTQLNSISNSGCFAPNETRGICKF